MKCFTPEIAWHNRDPVLCVDIHVDKVSTSVYRLVSGGADTHIVVSKPFKKPFYLQDVCTFSEFHQVFVLLYRFGILSMIIRTIQREYHRLITLLN